MGSVFVKVLRANEITMPVIFMALLTAVIVAILFGLFNGMLVAYFNIQLREPYWQSITTGLMVSGIAFCLVDPDCYRVFSVRLLRVAANFSE